MSFLEERKVLTREKRLSTLSHYNGKVEELADLASGTEIKQRIRTMTQGTYDEIIDAIQVLSKIEKAVVIIHGVVGCSAAAISYNSEKSFHWYSTNLNEKDTILGGDEKLRNTIIRAYEEHSPELIFVVGTPVVAINNDDIQSVILELEDELDTKIISIYTDGFKSKTPVNGYDIVLHSLLRYVVEPISGEEKEDFINVISLSESKENIVAVTTMLRDLGISYQLFPQYAGVKQIKKAAKARATIVLNKEEGSYFAKELEEVYGVPYIETDFPIGLRGTRQFLLKIGKFLGIEEKVTSYIEEQEQDTELSGNYLQGKTFFVDGNLSFVKDITEFLEEYGAKLAGMVIPYLDIENRTVLEKMKRSYKGIPVMISNGQPFEKANVLSKIVVDYYIKLSGNVDFVENSETVPVLLENTAIQGYEGIHQFFRQVKGAFLGKEASQNWQAKNSYYKDSWLKKSSNWYVKQEVK
ncbi:MAG: nitrogenase component 1 [Roseburia sp.]